MGIDFPVDEIDLAYLVERHIIREVQEYFEDIFAVFDLVFMGFPVTHDLEVIIFIHLEVHIDRIHGRNRGEQCAFSFSYQVAGADIAGPDITGDGRCHIGV